VSAPPFYLPLGDEIAVFITIERVELAALLALVRLRPGAGSHQYGRAGQSSRQRHGNKPRPPHIHHGSLLAPPPRPAAVVIGATIREAARTRQHHAATFH